MNPTETKTDVTKIIDQLRPIAKEFVDTILKDPIKTTQNNYARAMAMISDIESHHKGMGLLFLIAMQREGYPAMTVAHLKQIFGW